MREPVVVLPADPAWPEQFAAERRRIAEALGPVAIRIHHIGSTAVPGLAAKPIIDMLAEAVSVSAIDAAAGAMARLGYEPLGAFGIAGRRYFRRRGASGRRTHHLHAFEAGAPDIARHLAFRDFLRAHPERAAAYAALKRRLATTPGMDWAVYCDGKDPFVAALEREALAWRRG